MSSDLRQREIDITVLALSNFLSDKGGDWDWDDYTSMRLRTPELDAIRKSAVAVDLPIGNEEREELERLLEQVRQL